MKVPVRIYKMSGGGQYNVPKDGDVVAWLKREGDHVDKDEELCELETDKAVETIIAPVSGILVDIAYPVERKKPWIRGEMVLPLGDPI
ncbi:MAG: lipoyl domain-containing protein, partial [Patescibacteria group bacterium]